MDSFAQKMESLHSEIIRHDFGVTSVHLTEDDLAMVETKISYPLPENYRKFLTDYGGHSVNATFMCQDIPGHEVPVSINVFFGIFNSVPPVLDPVFDLLWNFKETQGERPDDLLPIGFDSGPGLTCIRLDGEFAGTVYFWDRVDSYTAGNYQDLWWVCDTFESFMDMLHSSDP